MNKLLIKYVIFLTGTWLIFGCNEPDFVGSDTLVTLDRQLPAFTSIEVSTDLEVKISKGAQQQVKVTSNDNLSEQLKTVVSNGQLAIELESGSYDDATFIVEIQLPELELLELNDNTRANLAFDNERMSIIVKGSSTAEISGNTDALNTEVRDNGTIRGFQYTARQVNTQSRDASLLEINCVEQLSGSVNQAAEVIYTGSPTLNISQSENGRVRKLN
ncbi:MAG: DUF2807 domain-containing protein [Bacteroidota bacterium]